MRLINQTDKQTRYRKYLLSGIYMIYLKDCLVMHICGIQCLEAKVLDL